MPWSTPTLAQVRQSNRNYIVSRIRQPLVPNSVSRALADANGGNAHLVLEYIDWLSLQLLPDTAETEFLDRQGNIWLANADGTRGRKGATAATGTVTIAGTAGAIIASGAQLTNSVTLYQTTAPAVIGAAGTTIAPITAVGGGSVTNGKPGDTIAFSPPLAGVVGAATVITLTGGTDEETDDELRLRVLQRIQKPPMGGDADDFVTWAMAFPGVTRAWCSPKEMGIGTVTVRFMMDDLRATSQGFPGSADVAAVQAWINSLRPVTALDTFVVSPIRQPVSFTLNNLINSDTTTLANIAASVTTMIDTRAAPASSKDGIAIPPQTIFAAWVNQAVMEAAGVESFDLVMSDAVMPNNGALAVLGNISFTHG